MKDRVIGTVQAARILEFRDPNGSGRKKVIRIAKSERRSLQILYDDGAGVRQYIKFRESEVRRFKKEMQEINGLFTDLSDDVEEGVPEGVLG